MTDIKMGEHQSREIEKFSPIVKCAKLDKNCEGCQAARKVMDINQHTNAMAVKKIKEQHNQIQQLQADKAEFFKVLGNLVCAVRPFGNQGDIYNKALYEVETAIEKHKDLI